VRTGAVRRWPEEQVTRPEKRDPAAAGGAVGGGGSTRDSSRRLRGGRVGKRACKCKAR
jgi:hypothetical protein